MSYLIRRAVATPELQGNWDGPVWRRANELEIAHFHPKSSPDHRPSTRAKLLYDDRGVYLLFRVTDQYVKCVQTEHQSHVYRDSCVEFFVQPKPDRGYFNIEMNCGGTMLLYYMRDGSRDASGKLANFQVLPPGEIATVRVGHSMPKSVPEEIAEPVEWWLEYFIPNALLERYVGALGSPAERQWRGNFYKCGDDTSHPHWAAWSPIERLDFHQPDHFAPLAFEIESGKTG